MPGPTTQTIFTALVLSGITYAFSVWSGNLTNHQGQQINAFLRRAQKYVFTETLYSIQDSIEKADARFFGMFIAFT